ncbi:MAG TPA: enolase C-terminal domain-like protein, partial [Gaiellaceae bacterium]|nr:enolase C-terminal domain-like protein [Gaiellaceae bacterium]
MELRARIGTITTREPFVIARGTEEENEVLWVEIRLDGVTGRGEAAPIPRYDESAASALAYAEEAAASLGDDPFALEEIMARLPQREFAARAAIDAALHDLQGKLVGRPVYQLLGLARIGPPTSWTIWLGDPDDMARRAEKVAGRYTRLKLKLGGRDGLDVDRVRAVRSVADVPLQVDVNEYWRLDEALDAIPRLGELGVEYVEQPLPAGDEDGVRLKQESPLPIYLDEDCHTLGDVALCAQRAHGINIKLAK